MTVELVIGRRGINPLFVLITASTGCAMTVLDTNVVAIVLPAIARDFRASFADVEWVISSYVLCFASLLLPAGAIADRFGRRRVFLIGIGAFAVTSLLCGIAPSAMALCLARALQGASAAFLLAPALAIIGHSFHGEAERSRAWAIWGGMMGLTMVLAPIIGGVIAYAAGFTNLQVAGVHVPYFGGVFLDLSHVREASLHQLCLTIVHEATHARIHRRGIRATSMNRGRLERICLEEEISFAVALGYDAAPLGRPTDAYWEDENRFARRLNELRKGGLPEWYVRAYSFLFRP